MSTKYKTYWFELLRYKTKSEFARGSMEIYLQFIAIIISINEEEFYHFHFKRHFQIKFCSKSPLKLVITGFQPSAPKFCWKLSTDLQNILSWTLRSDHNSFTEGREHGKHGIRRIEQQPQPITTVVRSYTCYLQCLCSRRLL